MYKIMVTVPLTHADTLRQALGDSGAGVQGNYSHCSFSIRGTGRFLPTDGARPFIGKVGEAEAVEEELVMVSVADDKLQDVLKAMKAAHPYDEIAFDAYRLEEV